MWSPDSRYIVFQSDREGDLAIFRQRADGSDSPERLSKPEAGVAHAPDSWSPDGGTLLVEVADEKVWTLWGLRVSDKTMTRVGDIRVDARFALDASFSPDGRWLAYRVDRTGTTPAIAVEPYPPNGSRVLADSFHPVWSRDGKTLWSRNWTTSAFVATPVITKPAFAFGTSQPLSIGLTSRPARNARISYDITRDAKIVDVIATQEPRPSRVLDQRGAELAGRSRAARAPVGQVGSGTPDPGLGIRDSGLAVNVVSGFWRRPMS